MEREIMEFIDEQTVDLSKEEAVDVLNDVIGECIARVEALECELDE